MGIPKKRASPSPPAASAAREAIYGPRKTVPTVVLNAELAQSYMAQPKISRRSFVVACGVVILPPVILNFVDLNKQKPVGPFWVAKIQECDTIRPFPNRPGAKIQAKSPLRINELSYIITVCYPAK